MSLNICFVLMRSHNLFVLLFACTASGRMLRKPQTKKPNFANVLVGIERKIKAGLSASLTTLQPPQFTQDIFGCALTVKEGMEDLRLSYTEVHVPTIISQACDFSNVYLEVGKSKAQCNVLLKALEEEWKGDKNYHRWCRKVAASESESMKKALKKLESDAEAKELLGACEKECPQVAKIIKTGAAVQEIMLEAMQPPAPGTKVSDLLKEAMDFRKKVNMHANTVCDAQKEMKCTLGNMPGSCTQMFSKINLPVPIIENLLDACTLIEPCKKACNGAMEMADDLATKQTLAMFTGATSGKEVMDLCKSYERVRGCYEKDECKVPFDRFLNMKERKDNLDKKCKVVNDPCFAKVTNCKDFEKFFGKGGDVPWDSQACTDKFYPWQKTTPEEAKDCCHTLGSLTECVKKDKCEQNLKEYLYVTPDPQWPEGEIVECACKPEWSKGFGEEACVKPNKEDPDTFDGMEEVVPK